MNVDLHIHTEHRIGRIDPRIFSGFLEHLGRAVYEGVYDPGNPLSDERGFRRDVIAALEPLGMPLVRYPGGNFVSAYDWRDGIGPKAQRPRRPDFAWQTIETNQFGTDEFMQWCEAAGTRPMMAVNLGTGTPADAAALVEYCNLPTGTSYADLRAANGHPEPYGVQVWCLGNEMDGPWQAGHVPAPTYAERALAASSLMKGLDRSIETVACGTSVRDLPTYLEWDRVVLEHCWDSIDYLSVHRYTRKRADDSATMLAEGVVIDQVLDEYRGLLAYVKGRRRSTHDVRLCFDEWNVWYRETAKEGGWTEAPHLLEEVYNLEDALVCAQYLHSFVRNADIVPIACIAQIVNVIAPILTRPDGVLRQSIYWPFALLREAVDGSSLRVAVRCPELATGIGDVPAVDAVATIDDAAAGCISIVNRSLRDPADVAVQVADRPVEVTAAHIVSGEPLAANSWDAPDTVRPAALTTSVDAAGVLRLQLPPCAHAVVRVRYGAQRLAR